MTATLEARATQNSKWTTTPIPKPWGVKLSADYLQSGYEICSFGEQGRMGAATFSLSVNQALHQQSALAFDKNKAPWALGAVGKDLLPFAVHQASQKGLLFDGPKIRLETDLLLENDALPVKLQTRKTTYFNGLATNDQSFLSAPLYDGASMFLENVDHGMQGTLAPLKESLCSNHLGASTIGITTDGVVIITGQSTRNLQSPGLLVPSGSGSVDWCDLGLETDLLEVIKRAAEREMAEECGFSPGQYAMTTAVIGFARMIHRGGKPEFFCMTRIHEHSANLVHSHDEDEKMLTDFNHASCLYKKIDVEPASVQDSIAAFCESHQGDMSAALTLNLKFLGNVLSSENESRVHRTAGDHAVPC